MNIELIIQNFQEALTVERKPDLSFTHKFSGYGIHKSECKVDIWKVQDKCFVLFTDINIGTSVTNSAEQLITEIYNKYLLNYKKEQCLFSETYDRKEKVELEAIDIIIPNWDNNKCSKVSWKRLGEKIINNK